VHKISLETHCIVSINLGGVDQITQRIFLHSASIHLFAYSSTSLIGGDDTYDDTLFHNTYSEGGESDLILLP
jgi:hypothetical protein